MICSGQTSNFAFTPARSMRVLLMVLTSMMCSSTSCAMSLSPVDISTGLPASAERRASVPMTSSASTPEMRSSGRPMAVTAASSGSICERRSSGMGGRCALYSANSSSRNVFPGASNTTTMGLSGCSCRNFRSMLSTPNTAPVGSPRELASGGRAWNARYRYDEPSMRMSGAALTWKPRARATSAPTGVVRACGPRHPPRCPRQ
jgi:hypothetical protein